MTLQKLNPKQKESMEFTNVELTEERKTVDFGMDAVVCPLFISGIRGGRSLDLTGFTGTELRAGHVIVKDTQKGVYKPMPVTGSAYGTLPENHEYVGILYKSIPVAAPMASIMTNGEVNSKAAPYPMTTILEAFKAACPNITFVEAEDE